MYIDHSDFEIDLSSFDLDLSDQKNALQYQLYKRSLAMQQIADQVVPAVAKVVSDFLKAVRQAIRMLAGKIRIYNLMDSEEYSLAASLYPRLAHLAQHAKKERVRKKNITRLFRIGCDILEKGGVKNVYS